MRSLAPLAHSRRGIRAAIAASLFATLFAAQALPQAEGDRATDRARVRVQAQDSAVALFEDGRDSDARQTLVSTNIRKAGTAGWHLETASRLLGVAWTLSDRGSSGPAMRAAALALEHTRQAVSLAGEDDGDLAANACLAAALIEERFLGDLDAAIESCRTAVRLAANKEPATAELARLEKASGGQSGREGGSP